jgi:tryptophanyl-tRNA synthetase
LLKLFATSEELKQWQDRYYKGGMGYGEAKKRLAELIIEYFSPFRQKRAELESNPDYVRQLLAKGAQRARAVAIKTLTEARKVVGLGEYYGR